MTQTPTSRAHGAEVGQASGGRPASTRAAKSEERRIQLAESALVTLGERGYAHTSLREIAQNSEFSHGVVHYYFHDKTELITYCVRHYKTQCATRYDSVVAESETAEELLQNFGDKLVETVTQDANMHRLWYDVRTQAMFEEPLREAVMGIEQILEDMIGRVVERYAELSGRPLSVPVPVAYAMFDGVFESHLLRHLCGDEDAPARLAETARATLPRLLG